MHRGTGKRAKKKKERMSKSLQEKENELNWNNC